MKRWMVFNIHCVRLAYKITLVFCDPGYMKRQIMDRYICRLDLSYNALLIPAK